MPHPTLADPITVAAEFAEAGTSVALATVVSTWKSAPREPGSMMCVTGDGVVVGSVSGGCVEAAVVEAAQRLLDDGGSRLLSFGVADADAWEVGLPCGGTIEILVQAVGSTGGMPGQILRRLAERGERADTRVLATALTGVEQRFVDPEGDPADPLSADVQSVVASDRSAVVDHRGERWFLHLLAPPVRLLVVGAGELGLRLARIADASGIEAVVVDPRTTFAAPDRLAGLAHVAEWPDAALDRLGLDRRTAVVTVSHDPKLDDPALRAALESDAFYIGALGSRKTHAARVSRLREAGFDEAALARIHAPVGLHLGSRTPGEIAVSVVAEMIMVLRGRD